MPAPPETTTTPAATPETTATRTATPETTTTPAATPQTTTTPAATPETTTTRTATPETTTTRTATPETTTTPAATPETTTNPAPSPTRATLTLTDRALATPQPRALAWALGACVALTVGSIAPWATASLLGISTSVSGLDGGGWVTLLTALVGAIAVLDPGWLSTLGGLRRRRLGIWFVLLVISVVVCGLNLADVETYGLYGIVHPGWGLWLSVVASLTAAGAAWVLRVQARAASQA